MKAAKHVSEYHKQVKSELASAAVDYRDDNPGYDVCYLFTQSELKLKDTKLSSHSSISAADCFESVIDCRQLDCHR